MLIINHCIGCWSSLYQKLLLTLQRLVVSFLDAFPKQRALRLLLLLVFLGSVVKVKSLRISELAFLFSCWFQRDFFRARLTFAVVVMVVRSRGSVGVAFLAANTRWFSGIFGVGCTFACLLDIPKLAGKVHLAKGKVSGRPFVFVFGFVGLQLRLIFIRFFLEVAEAIDAFLGEVSIIGGFLMNRAEILLQIEDKLEKAFWFFGLLCSFTSLHVFQECLIVFTLVMLLQNIL